MKKILLVLMCLGLFSFDINAQDENIRGPKSIYSDEEVEFYYSGFTFKDPNYYLYVTWHYDSNIFELIKYIDGGDYGKYSRYGIKLKVKDIAQESLITSIKMTASDKFLGKSETLPGGNISVTVKYKPTNLAIKSNYRFVCNNSLVNYSLEGMASFVKDYTINWQSTPTMTLVSGQGTATATYRASGNGYSTVNATVTYDGLNYVVENKIFINGLVFPSLAFIFTNSNGIGYWSSQTMGNSFDFRAEEMAGYSYLGIFTHYELYVTDMQNRERFRYEQILRAGDPLPWLPEGWYNFFIRGHTACGPTNWHMQVVQVVSGNGGGGGPILHSLKSTPNQPTLSPATATTPVSVKVYNFNSGTLMYSEKNVIDFNIRNTTLNDGIYIVVTIDQNGETKSEKIIKTRN